MKPTFGEPIKTIDDVIGNKKRSWFNYFIKHSSLDSQRKLFYIFGGEYFKEKLSSSAHPKYAQLAQDGKFFIPTSYEHQFELVEKIIDGEDYIFINGYLDDKEARLGAWYKSDEHLRWHFITFQSHFLLLDTTMYFSIVFPYLGYIANKKWPLKEKFYVHILRFSDVNI